MNDGNLGKMRLDGKTSFVTGGARGIGKSIAMALVEAESNIVIVDVDIEEARKIADELSVHGTKTMAIQTDVILPEQVDAMISQIAKEFGRRYKPLYYRL